MPQRIPQSVIEQLKERIAVQRLVEARGIELKPHGAGLIGRCPFHDDKTPSLVVTPAKNLWHCMGACQTGGSVIDWVMKAEGVSFRHAVELLKNDYQPAAVSAEWMPAHRSTVRKLAPPFEREAEDDKLLSRVIEFYHQTLLQNPAALTYLKKRGIDSEEAIRTFKLGYSNRTLGYRIPAATRVDGAAMRSQLQRLGLMRESGHEHFNGSLVIPIIHEGGEVTEVYGRKITSGLTKGTPLHLYLPGPHRGVWNGAALRGAAHGTVKEIILCEALIDALTFWCAGYRNVTASYGVEGFTADHLALFKQCGTERVLIAYDRDDAGDRAAEKLSKELMAAGLDCYRILFPRGMDANAYALRVNPAAKSLGVAIRSAQWLGKGDSKPITTTASAPRLESVLVEIPSVTATVQTKPVAPVVRERAVVSPATVEAPRTTSSPPPLSPSPPPSSSPPSPPLPSSSAVPTIIAAQAIPEAPAPLPTATLKALGPEHEYVITFGERRYRVRGLEKNLSYEFMRVNVLCAGTASSTSAVPCAASVPCAAPMPCAALHVDTFDLYQARHRAAFAKQAAAELGVAEEIIKTDLGKLLLALESEQEKLIAAAHAPKAIAVAVKMDEAERREALEWLRAPHLIERVAADFSRAGIVGERTNALVGYLSAISRKLDRPLALLIQSTSAAGKSSLMDAVLKFVPEEDRIVYSAMTGQSLFYMGEMELKHKILAIAEEEGAHRASYALKLLQSEGELTIASTSKDPETGKLKTDEYHVEGPVMIFSTTTAADLDEELKNRCLVLAVDESREQTAAIHQAQRARRTLSGLHTKVQRVQLLKLHQNAQRLIEPLAVMNPYAHHLTFLDDRTRTRRDHEKYLTLIDVIALLHQHQRELRTAQCGNETLKYIEATLEDIALANQLAHEVLGRTLDELPPQTRRLLTLLVDMCAAHCTVRDIKRSDYRFSRREVREHTHWGDTQLKIHLGRLVELEYVLVHRGGRGQSFEYELLYDGPADSTAVHLSGLIDVDTLRAQCTTPSQGAMQTQHYDGERSGSSEAQSGVGRDAVGAQSVGGRDHNLNGNTEKISTERAAPFEYPTSHGTHNGAHAPLYP